MAMNERDVVKTPRSQQDAGAKEEQKVAFFVVPMGAFQTIRAGVQQSCPSLPLAAARGEVVCKKGRRKSGRKMRKAEYGRGVVETGEAGSGGIWVGGQWWAESE